MVTDSDDDQAEQNGHPEDKMKGLAQTLQEDLTDASFNPVPVYIVHLYCVSVDSEEVDEEREERWRRTKDRRGR